MFLRHAKSGVGGRQTGRERWTDRSKRDGGRWVLKFVKRFTRRESSEMTIVVVVVVVAVLAVDRSR